MFQWAIDNAESIQIQRRPVVSQTTARDGTTRSVSRGNAPWVFTVKVASGIPYDQARPYISKMEKLDRITPDFINFSNSGYSWFADYQGNFSNTSLFSATWSEGQSSISVFGGSAPGGYRFRAGDFIQLNQNSKVYTVAADVPYSSTTVPLHRAVIDPDGSGTPIIGKDCNWNVICSSFPIWTLMARNQLSWDGAFTFIYNLL